MKGFACTIGYGIQPEAQIENGIGYLSTTEQLMLLETSGLRHSSLYGLATSLVIHACKAAIGVDENNHDRLGILVNGGPWNLEASTNFLRRSEEAGPNYVNPLLFPATLVSSTPTASSLLFKTRAFAYSVGHDELAFFDVLRRGRQALSYDLADRVLAVAVCADSPALKTVCENVSGAKSLLNVSMAFMISRNPSGILELIDAAIGCEMPWKDIDEHYEATLVDGKISFPRLTYLNGSMALSATSAVICNAAINFELAKCQQKQKTFAVSLRNSTNCGSALFRINHLY